MFIYKYKKFTVNQNGLSSSDGLFFNQQQQVSDEQIFISLHLVSRVTNFLLP